MITWIQNYGALPGLILLFKSQSDMVVGLGTAIAVLILTVVFLIQMLRRIWKKLLRSNWLETKREVARLEDKRKYLRLTDTYRGL